MAERDEAQTVAKRLHALLGGPEVTRKAAARELARRDPTDATELIHHLLTLAREGWEPASCVLSSMVAALTLEAAEIPYAHALRRLAEIQDLENVSAFLAEGPPKKEMNKGAAAKRDAQAFSDSLGHLKTKARLTRDRDTLTKLLTVSHPDVIRNALLNPRLTEQTVVNTAARRPSRPEPLWEIFKSEKWGVRHQIRRALVFNPYTPLELGAKLVPLLNETDLRELARDNNVHEAIRMQAESLVESVTSRRRGEPPRGTIH
ncbi:MAG: hypothetical protein ACJ790_15095 [Myxococcaceae bacterium]